MGSETVWPEWSQRRLLVRSDLGHSDSHLFLQTTYRQDLAQKRNLSGQSCKVDATVSVYSSSR
jgi:hypothetical protein